MWNEIKNKADIDYLCDIYDGFHDSCIVNITYNSTAYVDDEYSMHMSIGNHFTILKLQRQTPNPKTIELMFENVLKMNIAVKNEDFCDALSEALLKYENEMFIWAEYEDYSSDILFSNNKLTWIASKKLKWRIVD